ncbi:MAG: LacI family DNA-binding transcriptional regulator [Actinobacteria bacterium]|nr:LacI family DNA-binding transcriptional regulator [Actinomycetota bacterium]
MAATSKDDGKAGPRRGGVTLREVARLAGVHPGTASRAINEETRGLVNDATAQRVLAAAEQIGYRPNPIARGLKTSRSHTVGVLIPDLTNPLFPPIVRGIQDRLERDGYTPLIANTDNDAERERGSIDALSARRVDGLLTATAQADSAAFAALAELEIPVVLINRQVLGGNMRSVAPDDRAGVRLAVEHLVGLGHTKIAHLGGPAATSTGALRSESFVETMRRLGLDADPALTVSGGAMTEAEGERLCRQLLAGGAEFTAIVAANDLVALGCYDVFDAEGIDCPGDVSVVGFNDMRFADRFEPPLTTIRIPHTEMGVRAAELLLEQIRDPDSPARHELLEPTLVIRDSTAPPRRDP